MFRKTLVCIALNLLVFSAVLAQDTLAHWGFNENSGSTTKELVTNTDFQIHTKWPEIERVQGIRQNALRSDGYTFYADGNLSNPYPSDSFSVSLWVALETYPINTAAIWSHYDPQSTRGAHVSINKFGNIVVQFTLTNQVVVLTSTTRVQHWQWNFIVANIDAVNGKCLVYLNGAEIINQVFVPAGITWPNSKTYIGRTASTEMQDIFPVNYINGIYDEITVRRKHRTASQVLQEYTQLLPASVDMTTPSVRFANDHHRPKYHPVTQSGWANESHGLIYHNGLYHMFFQKNGNGPFFGQQNWGHIASADLVTWKEYPVALFPQPGFESVGSWSGHLVLNDAGVPTILYTGVDGVKAGIGSAQSTDDLLTWQRHPSNPLIPAAPAAFPNRDFRDPYVFKEGSTWYMIIGSGLLNPSTGTVFLYKSADLINWQSLGPMFTDNSGLNNVGIFWEMPVFWKFGNKYMLLVNKTPAGANPAKAFYWTGDFINEKFVPSNPVIKNLEIINSLLSPAVNLDQQNRVTAIGIIPDLLPQSEQYKHGWTHVFSLPRVWQLENDSLFQSPHPNIDLVRGTASILNDMNIVPGQTVLTNLRGFQVEIKAVIEPGNSSRAGFILEKNDNNTEFTKIYYDYVGQSFVVDRTRSSTNPNTTRDLQAEFFAMPPGPIEWHIYIDGSVIEIFINNKFAFATRVFPVNSNSNIIDLFAEGGTAKLVSMQVWNRNNVLTGLFGPSTTQYKQVKAWPVPASKKCFIQLPSNSRGSASISVYDVNGRKIKQFEQQIIASGNIIEWDLEDNDGRYVPAGNYFLTISLNHQTYYQAKMIVVR